MSNPKIDLEAPSCFAPAARDLVDVVHQQREAFLADKVGVNLLEAMPGPAMVLNERRQIVAANQLLLSILGASSVDAVLGRRPGEGVACIHSADKPGGCGTAEACSQCGAVNTILESLTSHGRVSRECRIQTSGEAGGGALDLRVHATFMTVNRENFVVVGLEDISSEKRRRVLERVFFHDIINLCGGLQGLARMLEEGVDSDTEEACKHDLARLSDLVVDEIMAHRQMLAAERGELETVAARVEIAPLFAELAAAYRHHPVAEGRHLRFLLEPTPEPRTDAVLLRRVLGNLVKNALEASKQGETVTVRCEQGDEGLVFSVHNPAAIPRETQLQIFQRSFSTKGGQGRGIGTYSVRLFGERYLGGAISFTSSAETGTMFRFVLPWETTGRRAA